jgi:predicted  nucleic acid-binding Zn-ribbon protein
MKKMHDITKLTESLQQLERELQAGEILLPDALERYGALKVDVAKAVEELEQMEHSLTELSENGGSDKA